MIKIKCAAFDSEMKTVQCEGEPLTTLLSLPVKASPVGRAYGVSVRVLMCLRHRHEIGFDQ